MKKRKRPKPRLQARKAHAPQPAAEQRDEIASHDVRHGGLAPMPIKRADRPTVSLPHAQPASERRLAGFPQIYETIQKDNLRRHF